MDQYISKPLKRFLFNSKEIAKKYKDKNSLNIVQYTAGSDEATIKMAEIKSIMKMPQHILETNLDDFETIAKPAKNNVLFSDSIETIDAEHTSNFDDDFIPDNNNSTKLVKVKLVQEPIKEIPTVLNLNSTNISKDSSVLIQENNESNGSIHLEDFTREPSVIKIKVKVKNNLESNDAIINESDTEADENISSQSNNESLISSNDDDKSIVSVINAKQISVIVDENSITPTINTVTEARSIEEFQNIPVDDTKHDVGKTCIFDENKTRPLSPIPVLPATDSPKTNTFRTVDNLIDFHERQVHKTIGRSPPKTLPRMGTSALFNRSPSKLNDSEIISALVHDRFVVNMYESRSFKRSLVKKPSQYGRIYKSLERTVNFKNDFITKQNLLSSDIVTVKQSSPIKLKDQPVSLKTLPVKQDIIVETIEERTSEESLINNETFERKVENIENNSSSSSVDQICQNIKNTTFFNEQIMPKSTAEILCREEFHKTPSSEYGSGSNSIQSSTISLEQQLVPENQFENTFESMEQQMDQIPQSPRESQYENTFESEVSSYNMEEFLKKALGDELNNLDNTELESKEDPPSPAPLTPLQPEESICTSNASDLISKINTFQSNFYRSFTRKLQHMTDTLRLPRPQDTQQSVKSDLDSLFSNNEEVTALLRQAALQYEALKQISKALTVCRNSKEFCVSTEQVEGERLLLVATYKRQAILDEIRRLEYSPLPTSPHSETGCVTITNINLPLKPATPEQPRSQLTKWYVGVFSSGIQVIATQPTPAAGDGNVKFIEEIVFRDLPTEFEVSVEVYCLLQRRQGRNFSHESKYHINKDAKRSHCPTPKKFLSREKSSQKIPARYDTGIRTSSFKLCGSLKLTACNLTKSGPWELRGKIPLCSSLCGTVSLNLKSCVQIPVKQSGFLTVGSESAGYASWNRRWCVLDGHVIKYWNYPSEEETCGALKEFDLKYCVNSKIQTADRSICPRPRTLLLEIARKPKPEDSDSMMTACTGSYTIERHYLSADNLTELNVWQEQLNRVVHALRIWNVGFLS